MKVVRPQQDMLHAVDRPARHATVISREINNWTDRPQIAGTVFGCDRVDRLARGVLSLAGRRDRVELTPLEDAVWRNQFPAGRGTVDAT